MPISILDALRARNGGSLPESIPFSLFDDHGLPMLAGCEVCAASLGPWDSYPSLSGYIRCGDCIGSLGFETTDAFEAFEEVTS